MAIFTVHAPPPKEGRDPNDPLNFAFVKDGFSWPTLFVPALWLAFHRMWLVLLGYLAVVFGFVWVAGPLIEPAQTAIASLFAIWFALEANEFRRWTLAGAGWRMIGVSEGRNRPEAERHYFERPRALPPLVAAVPPPPAPPLRPIAPTPPTAPQPPIIGLFPEPRPR